MECRSDESNRSDCDYKYEEEPEKMVVKKYKKTKAAESSGNNVGPGGAINSVIKEPIYYTEEVTYDESIETIDDIKKRRLLDFIEIIPFGFMAE